MCPICGNRTVESRQGKDGYDEFRCTTCGWSNGYAKGMHVCATCNRPIRVNSHIEVKTILPGSMKVEYFCCEECQTGGDV